MLITILHEPDSSLTVYKHDEGNFTGAVANCMPHGHGSFVWKNGDVYAGQWQLGTQSGHGQLKYEDGSSYEGEFKNGTYHGHGVEHNKSVGDWYNGAF